MVAASGGTNSVSVLSLSCSKSQPTSACLNISSISWSLKHSPRLVITCRNSAAEMKPLPLTSKTRKASMSSSSPSVSLIFRACMLRNSGKSMTPFPSQSTSLIMSCSSASVGFCPRDRMRGPSSRVEMQPRLPPNGLCGSCRFAETADVGKSKSELSEQTATNEVYLVTTWNSVPKRMIRSWQRFASSVPIGRSFMASSIRAFPTTLCRTRERWRCCTGKAMHSL
mmetsp:Transcript_44971/g.97866  ORF Transcript_44971/g.97866 Transcript_44971/m.97866 type:complete len:225 (-) Transcript_44971:1355-2029(-)